MLLSILFYFKFHQDFSHFQFCLHCFLYTLSVSTTSKAWIVIVLKHKYISVPALALLLRIVHVKCARGSDTAIANFNAIKVINLSLYKMLQAVLDNFQGNKRSNIFPQIPDNEVAFKYLFKHVVLQQRRNHRFIIPYSTYRLWRYFISSNVENWTKLTRIRRCTL